MTAIAIPYTSFGFVIAADGRQRWAHQPTRDRTARDAESDTVQKIFGFERNYATFACTVSGDVASLDRAFDLGVELSTQLALLQVGRFSGSRRFIESLSDRLASAIQVASGSLLRALE